MRRSVAVCAVQSAVEPPSRRAVEPSSRRAVEPSSRRAAAGSACGRGRPRARRRDDHWQSWNPRPTALDADASLPPTGRAHRRHRPVARATRGNRPCVISAIFGRRAVETTDGPSVLHASASMATPASAGPAPREPADACAFIARSGGPPPTALDARPPALAPGPGPAAARHPPPATPSPAWDPAPPRATPVRPAFRPPV